MASLLYCSVGCSRSPHSISWHSNGVLAYAANKLVALARYKDDVLQVFDTLHGHKDRVNCVQWVTHRCHHKHMPQENREEIISGSVDTVIRVWSKSPLLSGEFTCVAELKGHTEPVTCVSGSYDPGSHDTHVISASSDSTMKIWRRTENEDAFTNVQTLDFGRGFIMCADVFYLMPSKTLLLVCGGDDSLLHIYRQTTTYQFEKALSLSGHEDWIRDVNITQDDSDLLVASCSQDSYVRLWRVSETHDSVPNSDELKLKGSLFRIPDRGVRYSVTLETILLGHDDWVYSVHWQPFVKGAESATPTQSLSLLSVSMDKTMIVWVPDPNTGTWLDQARMGDVGGITLGLYGGVFGPTGDVIIAHGYQGAFHIWQRKDNLIWKPLTAPSGHFGPIQDISWEPHEGRYLVSVSSDQTSRLHAPWSTPTHQNISWHEMARPQVHGYDMQCVAMVTPLEFVSGAEEKVLRVFSAPENFIKTLSTLSGHSLKDINHGNQAPPIGASVPSLGLSNKAVFRDGSSKEPQEAITKNPFADHIPSFSSIELTEPPLEEHLLQNTLWPETQKLYGHGYELYCVACSPDGSLVASACKASKAEYAAIRVWDSASWAQVAILTHHTLTVTQMEFSHDSSKLLAVSRDRTWSLWNRNEDGNNKELFTLSSQMNKSLKAHSRIIWSCSWSHDDKFFATTSRDKRVCIWHHEGASDGWSLAAPYLELPQSATAVDFAPCLITDDKYTLAVGTEIGEITLLAFTSTDKKLDILSNLRPSLCHSSTVRRLKWRPRPLTPPTGTELVLASCSTDHSLKLININISEAT